jgi:cyanophycinase
MISLPLSKNAVHLNKLTRLLAGLSAGLLGLMLATSAVAAQSEGRLVIVGGALSNNQDDIFEALLDHELTVEQLKAAVIPAASSKPSFYGDAFRDTLIRQGLQPEHIRVLPLAVRDDPTTEDINESHWAKNGNDSAVVDWLKECQLVWFTGGDQSRITEVLLESKALLQLRALLKRGGTIGGTSAGAAMMSEIMIVGGSSAGALFSGLAESTEVNQEDGPLLVGKGLGFFEYGIIDQHFDAKARLGRLIIATAESDPSETGFGIDENTALVVYLKTGTAEVAGASQVTVVRNAVIENTAQPARIDGIRISSLGPGDSINLRTGMIRPSEDKSETTGNEYYNIPSPVATGVMSGYGNLNMLLTRLLVDNKASDTASSFAFSGIEGNQGYRLRFYQDDKTKGFWCYRDGQVDHYTVIDALLSIEPIKVEIVR